MAQNAPNCKDSQEIQFKLHDKFEAFRKCGEPRSNINLLAVSSSRGLLFAGNPNAPELKVIIIKDIAAAKSTGKQPLARLVPLPSIPNYIACSADGNLLAINYTQSNGTSQLPIYAVQSFMSPEPRMVYNIRLSPEDNVHAIQLLWNPVLPNSLAVVLSNGGLGMYALKDGGNFEMHSLDKTQHVKCGCWSPKGKQLVLGFPSGRLQQFKPDLTPAKTLNCPPNIHDEPFDTIAVHWLSTFQFAVVFLQHGEDTNPSLYIINAPKAGGPTYTNYYDICYSLSGPRSHQFQFTHVPQWNLLLVSSANGVEVGVLGTTEAGDTPTWQQLTLLDEARIELPLSEATQEETYPLGFGLDTSTTHQLTINEQQIPSMPMVHVLGTDGTLLSFDFLNLQPGAASVCSPPPPLADTSGKFVPLDALLGAEQPSPAAPAAAAPPMPVPQQEAAAPAISEISFAFSPNTVTSTPAPPKDKTPSLFAGFGGLAANKGAPPAFGAPATGLTFGSAPAAKPMQAPSFGGFGAPTSAAPTSAPMFGQLATSNVPSFGSLAQDKPAFSAPVQQPTPAASVAPAPSSAPSKPNNKPLYTVPPTFTPVSVTPAASSKQAPLDSAAKGAEFGAGEVDDVIAEIMNVQMKTFSERLAQQKKQTQEVLAQIESPATIKSYAKRLDDLQELNDQANDVDFELDVQGLRHGLSEAYVMTAECRAKLEVYKKPDITRLMTSTNFDAAGRRVLSRLQSYLAANAAQLQLLQQQIDSQWEQYQDVVRRNSKSKMNMPCLEGIYQRLTRLQNQVSDQRIQQNNIKHKLKERGLLQSTLLNQEPSRNRNSEAVDNLADSILAMTLNQVVDSNRAKLSQKKLQSIRQLLQEHKVKIISPQRPNRVGLKSEVILETRRKAELNKKTAAAAAAAAVPVASPKPAVAHKAIQAAAVPAPTQLAKPKPMAANVNAMEKVQSTPASIAASAPAPVSAPFVFSQSSPFVKTTAATVTTTTLSAGEAPKPTTSFFGGTQPFSFGGGLPSMPFGGVGASVKPQTTAPAPAPFSGFGNLVAEAAKPKPSTAEPPKEAPVKPLETKKSILPAVDLTTTAVDSSAKPATSAPSQVPAKSEPAAKPFSFAGFGNNLGSTIGGSSAPLSFGGVGTSLGKTPTLFPASTAVSSTPISAAPAVASTSTTSTAQTQETTISSSLSTGATASSTGMSSASAMPAQVSNSATVSSASMAPVSGSSASTAQPINNLFGSINICTPQTKDGAPAAPANIFSGFASGTTSSFSAMPSGGFTGKSFFSGVNSSTADSKSSTPTTATFTTPSATAASATPTASTAPSALTTATTTVATPAATSTTSTTATVAAPTIAAASTAATTTTLGATTVTSAVTPGSSFSFSNAFSNLGATSGTSSGSQAPTSTAPAASGSIFGGGNAFAPASTGNSPFGAVAAASTTPATGFFGNVPKPEASVFGATTTSAGPPTGLFASAAAVTSSASPFGSPSAATAPGAAPAAVAASGGSIFGQAAAIKPSGFGSPAASGGSIFGGGSGAVAPSVFGGGGTSGGSSIFGGGNNTQSSPAAAPTGSVFGQSVFGQPAASTGSSVFGSASPAQPQASGFGGGSIFGGTPNAASPAASGGSIFGGGNTSGGFGSFSQTASTPGAFGGFGQSGGSVAQSGFGSPQQQNQLPAGGFGAKPVFGGSPSFGGSPTFGGAPTFGSPKGFGTFGAGAAVTSPTAFGTAAKPPEGNIFETLGGTDTGLSFGNLAQTGNANNQKSTFGGSSFMNYR